MNIFVNNNFMFYVEVIFSSLYVQCSFVGLYPLHLFSMLFIEYFSFILLIFASIVKCLGLLVQH